MKKDEEDLLEAKKYCLETLCFLKDILPETLKDTHPLRIEIPTIAKKNAFIFWTILELLHPDFDSSKIAEIANFELDRFGF